MSLARSFSLTLLLSLAATLTAHAAHAKTLTIDRDLPPTASVVSTSFAADATSHRAWVVVDFLEGDPDQPIIVGSVYNAEHPPPHATTSQ